MKKSSLTNTFTIPGDLDVVQLLIENGANPSQFDLISAAASGHYETVKFLLENGANPNAQDGAALVGATENEKEKVVLTLLQNGANPNLIPPPDNPLYMAAALGYNGIVDDLLQHGARTDLLDEWDGTDALAIAKIEENYDIEKAIQKEREKRKKRILELGPRSIIHRQRTGKFPQSMLI